LSTSGSISVKGDYPQLKVKGGVKLDDARIAVGAEVLKDTSSFDVNERITIHRDKREVVVKKKEKKEEGPSVADSISVDLDVNLNSKVRLKADVPMSEDFGAQFAQLASMNVDLGLDGRLKIQQEQGVLSMLGELRTLRGEAVAMGKRFAITEGTVTFTGENYANPQLNLGAAHQVGQYGSVEIKIGGDVENTAMELSSPEYPDQTDVMSMLLFGKPTNAMSETEGESGAGLLSAAMASVGGQAARSTGASFLQNVQIDPGSGSVKVGFPLTEKIYLSIERVRPEADTDNMTQAAVEWLLSRAAYGEVVTGDRGKSSGDVYLRWRF
jgi:autotransporter translocation and assembly factor TamB